jgi:hypothetical protein
MTTFEGLFWWCLLFLGLKSHKVDTKLIRFYMCSGAFVILFIATFWGSSNGFQQRQSSLPSHLRDSGRGSVLYGFQSW